MASLEDLRTLGQIAKDYGIDRDRARHIVDSYGVSPAGRVGRTRVFDPEAAEKIVRINREITERVALQ